MAADPSVYSDCFSSLYLATLSSVLLYEHLSAYQSEHQSHKELVLILKSRLCRGSSKFVGDSRRLEGGKTPKPWITAEKTSVLILKKL